MAQATFSVQMDETLKKQLTCLRRQLSVSAGFHLKLHPQSQLQCRESRARGHYGLFICSGNRQEKISHKE